jgi:hypothetical protein
MQVIGRRDEGRMEDALIFLGLPLAIIVISYLLYLGLRDSEKASWRNIIMSAGLFLLCCGWLIIATMTYDWGPIVFIQILFGSGVAVFAGISLAFALKQWRKVAGLIVAVGIPLALYASLNVAFPYSPDQVVRRNGETIIARALNEYYLDHKTYPQVLNELVPNYVSDLREPKSIWGWLYIGDDKDFTLGYVFYVDKWGYTICKYSASSPKWDCPDDNSTAPFSLAPTPWP